MLKAASFALRNASCASPAASLLHVTSVPSLSVATQHLSTTASWVFSQDSTSRQQWSVQHGHNALMPTYPFGFRGASGAATAVDSPPEAETQDEDLKRHLGLPRQSTSYAEGYVAPHASMRQTLEEEDKLVEAHPTQVYDLVYLESIAPTHLPPKDLADKVGLMAVRTMRWSFDKLTGYGPKMTEAKWLQRMIFLETVAGVPGMVSGMLRHLHSLRTMRRDKGWIPCLLEEAENERMHLLTFLEMRKPGILFRSTVLVAQGVFFNLYFIAYLLWPKACHAFVGYLEEEAVRTYTHAIRDMDDGKLWSGAKAPAIARAYWNLKPTATMRDVILCVRADEACHSHVNHTLKSVGDGQANPFALGKNMLP